MHIGNRCCHRVESTEPQPRRFRKITRGRKGKEEEQPHLEKIFSLDHKDLEQTLYVRVGCGRRRRLRNEGELRGLQQREEYI